MSPDPRDNQEEERWDKVLGECKDFLRSSRRLREVAALKASGRTSIGLINPTSVSKKFLKKNDRSQKKPAEVDTELRVVGINKDELQRWRSGGECLRCAWPSDRKGAHWVNKCKRPLKLEKGTASFSEDKRH